MELVKRNNTQTLPYELIVLVLKNFSREFLVELYIVSTKYNPDFAQHIRIVVEKMERPLRSYIYHIYRTISLITTRNQYANTIAAFHHIKLIDNKEKEQIIYKNTLANKIENPKERRKFENLTKSVGKYCE